MKKKSENIFSQEEKDNILNKLNAERKKHQEEEEKEEKHSEYTQEEKNNILNKLNAERKKHQDEEKEEEEKEEEKHSEYTEDEKSSILNKLNAERKKHQEEEKEEKHSEYTEDEKSNIFEKLDGKRRKKQDKDRIHKYKYGNKKVYNLENKEFYKILGLGREFFIKTKDCHNHDSSPEMLTLYHHGFDGLRKIEALVNFKDDSDKIYISEDKLRVYFKASSLEEI